MKKHLLILTVICSIYSCSDSQDNQKKSSGIEASKADTLTTSILFEIVNIEENPINIDVYVPDTSKINELNTFFIKKYKTPGSIGMLINYFSNKKIAKIYFDQINKGSEKESDRLFKFFIARYNYNPGSGYDSLIFMHSK